MITDFLDRRNTRTWQYRARPLDPGRWIALSADAEHAATYSGQVTLLTAANLIGRMTPSIAVSIPPATTVRDPLPWAGRVLREVVLEQLWAATPFDLGGRFTVRAPKAGDYTITIGARAISPCIVHGAGWDAYCGPASSPLPATDNVNPFGPALAAVLAATELFISTFKPPVTASVCNALTWSDGLAPLGSPTPNPNGDLGDVWTIGTGSVGTAALYFLTLLTRKFKATLIDMDVVKVENLDRSPIFVAADVNHPKVAATAAYLRRVGVAHVRQEACSLAESGLWESRQQGSPDLVIAAANEDHVHYQIEAGMPPIQIYGTTGKNWQAAVIRHIPLRDPCSLCLFPDDESAARTVCATGSVPAAALPGKRIDAALPFLSFAAGLMAAAEIAKLSLKGWPFSPNRSFFSARAEQKLSSAPMAPRPGCFCQIDRSSTVLRNMIMGSRHAALSDA